MTQHPQLVRESIGERICTRLYSDATRAARAECNRLFDLLRSGDLSVIGDAEDATELFAARAAEAAWADGFLCGRDPSRLVFAQSDDGAQVHP